MKKCRHLGRVDAVTGGIEWPFEHKVVAYRCQTCDDYLSFGRAGPADMLELDTAQVIANYAAQVISDLGNPWRSISARDRWLSDRIDLLVRCYLAARRAPRRGGTPRPQTAATAARGFTEILIGAA